MLGVYKIPSSFIHRQYRPDPLHVYNKVDLNFSFFLPTISVMAIRLLKTKRKSRLTKQYYKFPLRYRGESHRPGSSRSDMQLPLLHSETQKWQLKSLVTCRFWAEQQIPVASPPQFPVANVGSRTADFFAAGCWRQLKQQLVVGSPGAIPQPSRALHKARGRLDSPKVCQNLWCTQKCHACSAGKAAINLQMGKIQASKMEELQNIHLNCYLLKLGEHINKSVLQIDI